MQRILAVLWSAVLLGFSSFSHAEILISDYRVLSSHNSYHVRPLPDVLELIKAANPEVGQLLDISQPSLAEQLERYKVRHFEFDVFADPQGGHFRYRYAEEVLERDPWARDPELAQPGFKVLHLPDFDYRSHCLSLHSCLQQLKTWSDAHPQHLMITVQLEVVSSLEQMDYEFQVKPLPFTRQGMNDLEQEIRQVFPPEQLITPDQVRGSYPSLREAVRARNWPSLAQARGKFLFALNDVPRFADAPQTVDTQLYVSPIFFIPYPESHSEAGFFIINSPQNQVEKIRSLVAEGFLVRTQADADTVEAVQGNSERFNASLKSNAQFISTDYLVPHPQTGYVVSLGNVVAECLPLKNSVSRCHREALRE